MTMIEWKRVESAIWSVIKWPYTVLLFGSAVLLLADMFLTFMPASLHSGTEMIFGWTVALGWLYMILFRTKITFR